MKILRLDKKDFEHWEMRIPDLIKESVDASFPQYDIDMKYCMEKCQEIRMYLKEDKAVLFLAVDGNELAGFIWCHQIQRFDERRLHVAHLSVLPVWRKQGVGSRLVETAVHYAKEQKLSGIELFATASNSEAVRFYENVGFEVERYLFAKIVS